MSKVIAASAFTTSPWCCPGRTAVHAASVSPATCTRALASSNNASRSTTSTLQRLPPVAFRYDLRRLDVVELADLLQQVACFAPGQSFHSSSSNNGGCSGLAAATIDPHRLQGALQCSLVCVAAYAGEQHLPPWQHLSSRGLAPQQQQQPEAVPFPALPLWQQRQQRQVLVGFARAVGDTALVATVHDVVVMPELQQLGLGRQLLARLVRQLDTAGIVDVGLLAPQSSQGFFASCSFGRDSEGSTTMTLSPDGMQQRAGVPLAGMQVHVKPPASWNIVL